MSVSNWFEEFCKNLSMEQGTVDTIRSRYRRITKTINQKYWNSDSEIANSLYVGSYGRGTDIWVSDIDVLVILPWEVYQRFDLRLNNKQSQLLQEVKSVIEATYSQSYIKGDGQVIVVSFYKGITFEIVPCFEYEDGSFCYPDSNYGGSWKQQIQKMKLMKSIVVIRYGIKT